MGEATCGEAYYAPFRGGCSARSSRAVFQWARKRCSLWTYRLFNLGKRSAHENTGHEKAQPRKSELKLRSRCAVRCRVFVCVCVCVCRGEFVTTDFYTFQR